MDDHELGGKESSKAYYKLKAWSLGRVEKPATGALRRSAGFY